MENEELRVPLFSREAVVCEDMIALFFPLEFDSFPSLRFQGQYAPCPLPSYIATSLLRTLSSSENALISLVPLLRAFVLLLSPSFRRLLLFRSFNALHTPWTISPSPLTASASALHSHSSSSFKATESSVVRLLSQVRFSRKLEE
jgi:hypothetical protein